MLGLSVKSQFHQLSEGSAKSYDDLEAEDEVFRLKEGASRGRRSTSGQP